jgi:hypothetical protein
MHLQFEMLSQSVLRDIAPAVNFDDQISGASSVPTLIEQSQLVGRSGLGHDDRLQRK